MDFRILGPLEVDHRGRRWRSAGRGAALLASLLLRAGEIVPEDRLLDEVWRGEPPPSGGAALRVRISQLRKALAATGSPPALTTRPPGYVLEVDAGQVDALRFERLLGEGRRLLADAIPPQPRRRSARRSSSGAGPRWPSSQTIRSPPPRAPGSRSCASRPSRSGSRRSSRSAGTGSSRPSSKGSSPSIRSASGCAGS